MGMAETKLDIFKLVKFGSNKKYPKGFNIFLEGSFGQEMYIVLKGSCDVSTGGVSLTLLKPGSFFGEMSLLTELPRSATVKTAEETYLLVINHDNFTKIISEEPVLAFKLMQVMAERIRKLNIDIKMSTKQLARTTKSFSQSNNKAHNDVLENSFYEGILHKSMHSQSGYSVDDVLGLFGDEMDVACLDAYGKNILGSAVMSGDEKKVALVLEKKVGMEVADSAGNTPLMLACMFGYTDIVKLLLSKGANANTKNANDESALMTVASLGFSEIIPLLVAAGADMFKVDSTGNTALCFAAVYGKTECVEKLLELKCDIDHVDKFGNTPLIHALKAGNEEIALLLVDADAHTQIKDKHDNTVQSLATKHNFLTVLTKIAKL